jgi:hypothetical protein
VLQKEREMTTWRASCVRRDTLNPSTDAAKEASLLSLYSANILGAIIPDRPYHRPIPPNSITLPIALPRLGITRVAQSTLTTSDPSTHRLSRHRNNHSLSLAINTITHGGRPPVKQGRQHSARPRTRDRIQPTQDGLYRHWVTTAIAIAATTTSKRRARRFSVLRRGFGQFAEKTV